MILDSSLIELIYDAISKKCGYKDWHKKLSFSDNKDIIMKEFYKEVKKFFYISFLEWNILREIKDTRNKNVHKAYNKVSKDKNKDLILSNESKIREELFKKCFDFLDANLKK